MISFWHYPRMVNKLYVYIQTKFMAFCGSLWHSLAVCGILWYSVEVYSSLWQSLAVLWQSLIVSDCGSL